VLHGCERGVVEDSDRNVDACVEEELHDDVHSVLVVADTEVDIRREVRSYMPAHAGNHSKPFLDLEVALLQQLAYSPHVPSQDVMKGSMVIRDEEESAMPSVDTREWLGAYYQ
jgi:hypothetical protein